LPLLPIHCAKYYSVICAYCNILPQLIVLAMLVNITAAHNITAENSESQPSLPDGFFASETFLVDPVALRLSITTRAVFKKGAQALIGPPAYKNRVAPAHGQVVQLFRGYPNARFRYCQDWFCKKDLWKTSGMGHSPRESPHFLAARAAAR
jgi:hypothetical protein